jgi:hypothetical protein
MEALRGTQMTRICTALFALALFSSGGVLFASAQQPPPEGAPMQGSPYGQAYGPNPSATTNPALLARAKSWFAALQKGKVDRSQLAAGPNGNMTDASIAGAQKMIGSLGAPVSFVQERAQSQGNVSAAIYQITFKNGEKVDFLFAVDSDGKVAGMSLGTPH